MLDAQHLGVLVLHTGRRTGRSASYDAARPRARRVALLGTAEAYRACGTKVRMALNRPDRWKAIFSGPRAWFSRVSLREA